MKVKNINKFKERLVEILFKLIIKLENIGDSDMLNNGEKTFIDDMIRLYEGKNFTVFDVGANVGEYSERILRDPKFSSYQVHIFEPQEKCFEELMNKFSAKRQVFLNHFGVSDQEEGLDIYSDREKSGLASLYKRNLGFYGLELSKIEKIQLKRLDWYVESKNIKRINLLKLDVEGHELKVLEGLGKYLSKDFIDFIQFEYGGANLDSRTSLLDFYSLLQKCGFKLCKIMKGYLEEREYNPRFENFVYQNWVAVSEDIYKSLHTK